MGPVEALVDRGPGGDERDGLRAVSPGAGELDGDVVLVDVTREAAAEVLWRLCRSPDHTDYVIGLEARRAQVEPGLHLHVLLHPEREHGHHVLLDPLLRFQGRQVQVRGALGEHLDEPESLVLDLQLQRLLDGLLGAGALLVVEQRDALHVHRRVHLSHHLGHPHGLTGDPAASRRRRGRALAAQRRGCHLPTGHAVDRVVHEDERHGKPHRRGLHDLRQADGGQVAVALVAQYHRLGVGDLMSQCDGGRPPVRRLRVPDVQVVVHEDRAPDR